MPIRLSRAFLPATSLSRTATYCLRGRPDTTQLHQFLRRAATTRKYTIHRKVPSQAYRRIESSVSLSTVLLGLLASSATGYLVWTQYSPTSSDTIQDQDLDYTTTAGMPADVPQGWPGNLSPEQETKLKELWAQLSRITGVLPPESRPSVDDANATDSDSTPKKKKGRFSFLRRSKDEDAPDSAEDDKHGQMKEYKQAIADQTPEQLRDTIWSFVKQDDPDALLLRFLRARKWDVHQALVMMISTVHWRGTVVHLDDELMPRGEQYYHDQSKSGSGAEKQLGQDFMKQMEMGKSFIHGTDKDGRPICFVRVRLHHGGDQGVESLEKYTIHTIETARMTLRPPVDTAVIVFDMTGFSMANMDYTPVKFMIKCFEANYPESLGAVCVHRSPWLFQGIWNIIKGWLDPVVAAKVHFTKDATELSQFIPMKQIPKECGGEEDWEYSYIEPRPDENAAMKDTATRDRLQKERWAVVEDFEKATLDWWRGEGDAGQSAAARRAELAKKLRENYWALDPYVRAKSLCDRTGVLQQGGVYEPYPKSNGASATHDDLD